MTARILIADGADASTRHLQARLAAEYYQSVTVRSGAEALLLARSWRPDIVILDAELANIEGAEACLRLKSDPETLHIPVLIVSRRDDRRLRLAALEAGADDCLPRPVDDSAGGFGALLLRARSLSRVRRLLDELQARGETARTLGFTQDRPVHSSVSGARVLVVDDDTPAAQGIQDMLSRDGIIAGRAANAGQATALSAAIAFDMIAISLAMDIDDPLLVAARLRAGDATRDVPILLIAADGDIGRVRRGVELGADDWLWRPFDAAELRARARNQIRRHAYRQRLRTEFGTALEMALIDPLTGLYNRRYLVRHLAERLAASQAGRLSVLMVDVDRFKAINDTYGHTAGDQALRVVAETLRRRTRVFDMLARTGGEEFVIVMPGADAAGASSAAERLRRAIAEIRLAPQGGPGIALSVSIGVASNHVPEITADMMLQAADQAMYRAKEAGRNRVVAAE